MITDIAKGFSTNFTFAFAPFFYSCKTSFGGIMGQTILYNKGFEVGAIMYFLVSEKGIGFADSYDIEFIDSESFHCGFESGFRQYE